MCINICFIHVSSFILFVFITFYHLTLFLLKLIIIILFLYVINTYKYQSYYITKGIVKDNFIELLVPINDLKYVTDNKQIIIESIEGLL